MRLLDEIISGKKRFDFMYSFEFKLFFKGRYGYIKNTLRCFRRGLSYFNAMLSDRIKPRSCRPYKTFLVKFQAKLSQLESQQLLPYVFPMYFLRFAIPEDLKTYSYIWKNITLFENYERCSIVRSERRLIIILHYFTKRIVQSILEQMPTQLFRHVISSEMMFPQKHVERQNLYFTASGALVGNYHKLITMEEIIKYRFIDTLKGFAGKDSIPHLPDNRFVDIRITTQKLHFETLP